VASNSWLGICTQSICTIPTGFRLAQIFVFRTWIFYPPQSRSHAEIRGEPFGCLGETFQLHPNVCRRRRLAFLSLWLRDTCTCCCTFWGFELANKTSSSSSSFGGAWHTTLTTPVYRRTGLSLFFFSPGLDVCDNRRWLETDAI
jgi:hypothetical protein